MSSTLGNFSHNNWKFCNEIAKSSELLCEMEGNMSIIAKVNRLVCVIFN